MKSNLHDRAAYAPLEPYVEMLSKLDDRMIGQLADVPPAHVAAFRRLVQADLDSGANTSEAPAFRKSRVDAFASLVGTRPDNEIAAMAGVDRKTVLLYRQARKIPAAVRSKTDSPDPVSASPVAAPAPARSAEKVEKSDVAGRRQSVLVPFRDLLGVLTDAEVAVRAGVGAEAVRRYRVAHGIQSARSVAAAASEAGGTSHGRSSRLDAHRDILGVLSDRAVAERVGMSAQGVSKYRLSRGIPTPPRAG